MCLGVVGMDVTFVFSEKWYFEYDVYGTPIKGRIKFVNPHCLKMAVEHEDVEVGKSNFGKSVTLYYGVESRYTQILALQFETKQGRDLFYEAMRNKEHRVEFIKVFYRELRNWLFDIEV